MGQGVEMEKESGRGHGIGALLSVPSNRISFVAHRLTGSNFITSSLSASSGLPSVRAQPHFPPTIFQLSQPFFPPTFRPCFCATVSVSLRATGKMCAALRQNCVSRQKPLITFRAPANGEIAVGFRLFFPRPTVRMRDMAAGTAGTAGAAAVGHFPFPGGLPFNY